MRRLPRAPDRMTRGRDVADSDPGQGAKATTAPQRAVQPEQRRHGAEDATSLRVAAWIGLRVVSAPRHTVNGMASSPFLAAIRSLPQRGSRGILSGALVLGCLAAACLAADAPPPAPQTQPKDQPPQETRVFTLGPAEAVPTDFTIRTGVAGIVRTIEDFRKDLPPGHKTKVVMGKFYNANNGRFEDGIVSLTPLDDQGKIDGVERHFDLGEGSGGLARTVAYKHGVQDGPEQLYAAGSRSGRYVQKTVLWKAGRIEGAVRMFHPNGKLMSEATYAAGVLEGMTRSFAPDGSLVRQTPYKAGQRHGTSTEYWPGTDKLKSVIPYDTGKAHGLARLYSIPASSGRKSNAARGSSTVSRGNTTIRAG